MNKLDRLLNVIIFTQALRLKCPFWVKKAARLSLPKRNWSRRLDSMRQFARKLVFRCGKLTLSAFGPAKNSSYGGTILFVIV